MSAKLKRAVKKFLLANTRPTGQYNVRSGEDRRRERGVNMKYIYRSHAIHQLLNGTKCNVFQFYKTHLQTFDVGRWPNNNMLYLKEINEHESHVTSCLLAIYVHRQQNVKTNKLPLLTEQNINYEFTSELFGFYWTQMT